MFNPLQYNLLDFGRGRRLERFGEIILDRPCPAAETLAIEQPSLWREAHARFDLNRTNNEADRGHWSHAQALPECWTIDHQGMKLELKPTLFGHIGVFPEQAANWDWIDERLAKAGRPLKILNLFAYTGGSTLAALRAGAQVTHVDSARNIVAWARRNAAANGLADAPVRWIVDDAMKFVAREVKRGVQYDGIVLDPPSYGHGSHGEPWQLAHDLPRMLEMCAELTRASRQFMLLTCHTRGFSPARLRTMISAPCEKSSLNSRTPQVEAFELTLESADGRSLPCGTAARC
jgi:23S rRNA (cytosine1962-C5)-methyltransferase